MIKSIYLFILFQLLIVAYQDFRTKKILNIWSLSNIVFAVLFYTLFPVYYVLSWNILITFVVSFVIGALLYSVNIMGAGDVKYLSTFFLLLPVYLYKTFVDQLIIVTIIVGSALLVVRFYNIVIKKNKEKIRGSSFSYAPVILLAWISLAWRINAL